MNCQYCTHKCIKYGKQKSGVQRYYCKHCKRTLQEGYKYQAKWKYKKDLVCRMLVNNAGFRGIARTLRIAVNTVLKIVQQEAVRCAAPLIKSGCVFEIDELKAYHKEGKPEIWAVYGLERKSKKVLGISTGRRDKQTLRKTVNSVLTSSPKRIYTDGHGTYKNIIPSEIHKESKKMLCCIERCHLTLRNALKMLNRKTLSYVRKPETLLACLKLFFWGGFL